MRPRLPHIISTKTHWILRPGQLSLRYLRQQIPRPIPQPFLPVHCPRVHDLRTNRARLPELDQKVVKVQLPRTRIPYFGLLNGDTVLLDRVAQNVRDMDRDSLEISVSRPDGFECHSDLFAAE